MPFVAVVDGAPAGPFAIGHLMFTSMAIGGSATTARALAAGLTPDPALLAGGRKIASMAAALARDGPFGRLAAGRHGFSDDQPHDRPQAGASLAISTATRWRAFKRCSDRERPGDRRIGPELTSSQRRTSRRPNGFPARRGVPVVTVLTTA